MVGVEGRGLHFDESDMEECAMLGCTLINASFTGTNLAKANVRFCDLRAASFGQADLRGANLSNSDLAGANFQVYSWTQEDNAWKWRKAILDETTIMPDGSKWTKDLDLTRFTDPKHPDYKDYRSHFKPIES